MIALHRVRPLLTEGPAEPGRPTHVSAASGAVHHDGVLYVVADDELSLAAFPDGSGKGRWHPLLAGELPLDPELRKAVKADFETLSFVPRSPEFPNGALLALGSGSHPRRRWGSLLAFGDGRSDLQRPHRVDLNPLYEALRATIPTLNVEGAVFTADKVLLLQRGTAGASENAIIHLDHAGVLHALEKGTPLTGTLLQRVTEVRLPELHGVQLGFTDGQLLPDGRIVFSAVAEDTRDAYVDGPCTGSAIGLLSVDGKVHAVEEVTPKLKIEGLCLVEDRLWCVTDVDDPVAPAELYQAPLPTFAQ